MRKFFAFVGTYSVRGSEGIYTFEVDTEKETVEMLSVAPSMNASFLAVSSNQEYLYAVQESMIFQGYAGGGIAAYRIMPDGQLQQINAVPTGGQLPCYIDIRPDGKEIYAASYRNGSFSAHSVRPDGGIQKAHTVIQHPLHDTRFPCIHCSKVTPDGKFLCCLDVTRHHIVFYELESGKLKMAADYDFDLKKGYRRPRQIAFSQNKAYIITEAEKDLYVFDYNPDVPGFLREIQHVHAFPCNSNLRSGASGVKLSPDGKLLAVSLRDQLNMIATFQVGEDGRVGEPAFCALPGITPRDFAFTPNGTHILAGTQFSDSLELLKVECDGSLTVKAAEIYAPSPACVKFLGDA